MTKQIHFTIERLSDVDLQALQDLTRLHYHELCPYNDIPLSVDMYRLLRLEKVGILKFFTVRDSISKLVGYAIFNVATSTEYSTSLQASMQNIFIHPDYRGQGGKFISWCDEQLKEMGVQVVYHHTKVKKDYGVLLKRLGYESMNIVYAKRLDK